MPPLDDAALRAVVTEAYDRWRHYDCPEAEFVYEDARLAAIAAYAPVIPNVWDRGNYRFGKSQTT